MVNVNNLIVVFSRLDLAIFCDKTYIHMLYK
jgi:hypothetical protein